VNRTKQSNLEKTEVERAKPPEGGRANVRTQKGAGLPKPTGVVKLEGKDELINQKQQMGGLFNEYE